MREPAGLILAGGRATRLGGVDKAGVMLGKQRLLDHCADRLAPQVCAIALNSNTAAGDEFDVVPDNLAGHLGPLAGVLAGLDWAHTNGHSHIVTVAVDTPFFPCDLVPRLLLAGDGGLAVASTSDGIHGTFGLWPVALRKDLSAFLNDGGRKVRAFSDEQSAAIAMFPDTTPPAFFNINRPEDLAQAQEWV